MSELQRRCDAIREEREVAERTLRDLRLQVHEAAERCRALKEWEWQAGENLRKETTRPGPDCPELASLFPSLVGGAVHTIALTGRDMIKVLRWQWRRKRLLSSDPMEWVVEATRLIGRDGVPDGAKRVRISPEVLAECENRAKAQEGVEPQEETP